MKIKQGYKSSSMDAFQFLEMHKLEPLHDKYEPLVVFGCYNTDDLKVILEHHSIVVIQWEGLDSKKWKDLGVFKNSKIINVTPHPNIKAYFDQQGLSCSLIRWAINDTVNPQILGNKVYSYVNKNSPVYYGSKTLEQVKTKHPFLIADYTIPANEWRNGPRDEAYAQTFVGLQLCEYAGGGFGIVELGLRGISVVNNILKLPNCIPWNTVEDIENAIERESKNIGKVNKELAQAVYDSVLCSEKLECYDLGQLVIKK
jgi:hypothetical protein